MRFSLIVLVAVFALVCKEVDHRASAAPSAAIPSCHATSPGVFQKSSVTALSQAGVSDIVLPTKGNAGKNFNGANIGIFAFGCKVPPLTVMPPAPPKPADPNAGKYPLEMGPVQ